jgi:hypothetical protein
MFSEGSIICGFCGKCFWGFEVIGWTYNKSYQIIIQIYYIVNPEKQNKPLFLRTLQPLFGYNLNI